MDRRALADLRRPRLRARTLISAAVAVAAHVVLILGLALGIHVVHPPNEAPPIEVSLVNLFTPHPRPAKAPHPAPRPATPAPPAARPPSRPAPSQSPPPPSALPENGPIDPRIAAAEAVRGALQATVRCAHPDAFNMTPTEREACAQHIRDLRAGAPTYGVFADDHMRHDPPVASHGMAAHIGPLSPRPGNDLGVLDMGPVKGNTH